MQDMSFYMQNIPGNMLDMACNMQNMLNRSKIGLIIMICSTCNTVSEPRICTLARSTKHCGHAYPLWEKITFKRIFTKNSSAALKIYLVVTIRWDRGAGAGAAGGGAFGVNHTAGHLKAVGGGRATRPVNPGQPWLTHCHMARPN